MSDAQYEIGMVGLGVMGRNLVLNMADHGHSVAGLDKDAKQVKALRDEAGERKIEATGGRAGVRRRCCGRRGP